MSAEEVVVRLPGEDAVKPVADYPQLAAVAPLIGRRLKVSVSDGRVMVGTLKVCVPRKEERGI